MERPLIDQKDQLENFIRAAQYISRLTVQQDVYEHLSEVVVNFFKADWAAFANKAPNQEIAIRHCTISDQVFRDSVFTAESLRIISNVLDSGFLDMQILEIPDPYMTVFLPIHERGQINNVMLIGYKSGAPLHKDLLNLFLAVTGLAETAFERLAVERELRSHRNHLEQLVRERTSEIEAKNSRLTLEIIERKHAEDALRRSEEQTRLLLNSTAEAIYGVDLNGDCTFCNASCLKLLGYKKPEDLVGKNMHRQMHHQRKDGTPLPDDECRMNMTLGHSNGVHVDDEVFWRADGTFFPAEYWSYPQRRDGKIVGAVVTFLDITDRKRAEQEKQALLSHLSQSQKLEALGTLVGGIAHDFNNMLQSILGYSEILLMGKKQGDPGYKALTTITKTGKEGAELVKKLLAFGQQGQVFPVSLDLNDQIGQLTTLISHTLPQVVKVDLDLFDGPTTISLDPSQIDQVIMNLAINGSEAMPNGGKLKIVTKTVSLDEKYCRSHHGAKPGKYVMLSVADTGRGMDKETLARIFDPFFSTKERGATRGTGLGLSVVNGIVQQQGGHVTCQSFPGKGTEFKVYFPAIEVHPESQKKTASSVQSQGIETILVVEDNISVAELEESVLTSVGYIVILASNAQEALDIYQMRKAEISLVILDLLMPEMSGRDCLIELVEIDPLVRVLIASGYAPEDELRKEISPFVKGFLRKPFGVAELIKETRSALDSV